MCEVLSSNLKKINRKSGISFLIAFTVVHGYRHWELGYCIKFYHHLQYHHHYHDYTSSLLVGSYLYTLGMETDVGGWGVCKRQWRLEELVSGMEFEDCA